MLLTHEFACQTNEKVRLHGETPPFGTGNEGLLYFKERSIVSSGWCSGSFSITDDTMRRCSIVQAVSFLRW